MERAQSVKHSSSRSRRSVSRKNTVSISVLPLSSISEQKSNTSGGSSSSKKRKAHERKTPRTPRSEVKKPSLTGVPTPSSQREATRFSLAFEVNESPSFLSSDSKLDSRGSSSMRASEMIEFAFEGTGKCTIASPQRSARSPPFSKILNGHRRPSHTHAHTHTPHAYTHTHTHTKQISNTCKTLRLPSACRCNCAMLCASRALAALRTACS